MRAADESFTQTLRSEDVAAAGLDKLSPEERVRLDALVSAYRSGALQRAEQEAETERAKAVQAEEKARLAKADADAAQARATAAAAEKKSEPSLLQRAAVLLRPGTKVEYSTLESRLAGPFKGWEKGTVFRLENGQSWRVTSDSEYVTPTMPAPAVKIAPGALGSFWMMIEGVRQRVRVESLDAAK